MTDEGVIAGFDPKFTVAPDDETRACKSQCEEAAPPAVVEVGAIEVQRWAWNSIDRERHSTGCTCHLALDRRDGYTGRTQQWRYRPQ